MKRIKKYIARQIYEFLIMPKIWQLVCIIFTVVLIYLFIDLYKIKAEIRKVQAERDKLERWPF